MKKTIILATTLLLTLSANADRRSIKDRTENWLQRENAEETTGNLRGAIEEDEEAVGTLFVPVGEGLLVLVLLASAYCVQKRNAK
jgi:hypothetical protein